MTLRTLMRNITLSRVCTYGGFDCTLLALSLLPMLLPSFFFDDCNAGSSSSFVSWRVIRARASLLGATLELMLVARAEARTPFPPSLTFVRANAKRKHGYPTESLHNRHSSCNGLEAALKNCGETKKEKSNNSTSKKV